MLCLFSSLHNLINFTSTTDALIVYGSAFGTGAGLSVALCLLDMKVKKSR